MLLKLISAISFCFYNAATKKVGITYVAHIIFFWKL